MAGYGGIINDIGGSLGIGPLSDNRETPAVPNAGQVGRRYQNLLNAYIGSAPSIYGEEAQYQPLYTQLGLANQQAARQAAVSGTAAVAPQIMAAERAYNPQATGLLDTLGQQASTQLAQNGGLDPAMQRQLTQNVRSSQAARGLGYGPGDAAMEDYYVTNTMEQRRQANQQFASNVGQLQEQYYKDPFAVAAGVTQPVSATPTIISPQQSDSMMGTTYNAQAAANIASANNATASDNAY
jgi:hypothetical protein